VNKLLLIIAAFVFGISFFSGEQQLQANKAQTEEPPGYRLIPVPTPSAVVFTETFDGSPDKAEPWNPVEWDIAVHSRDTETWNRLEKMDAAHGSDCSPHPAKHPVTYYRDAVYQCRDHIMTAINASGYGAIYLTPNHMVDFTDGKAVIRFDMTTARTSGRDWIDLWITPYEDNLQLPLSEWLPDLSGEPKRSIQVEMGFSEQKSHFKVNLVRNFQVEELRSASWIAYEDYLTPSSTRRDTFELQISRSHVMFGMPDYDIWWVDEDIPALDWTVGVVQLGHHSYTPEKDCGDCAPNTWHWDNVEISPAVPFTIIPARQRFGDQKNSRGRFHLTAPAPNNANLRFSAVGKNLEVSFDRGKTWQKAQPQAQKRYEEGPFWSYWMPVPAKTSQVWFKGDNWWGGDWRVKDLSVWALSANE
jgi:hypothetical protein